MYIQAANIHLNSEIFRNIRKVLEKYNEQRGIVRIKIQSCIANKCR